MTERWAPIAGWEGHYEISDQGRIRTVARDGKDSLGRRYVVRQRVITEKINPSNGYQYSLLINKGTKCRRPVHQLVLETFVGPRPPGMFGCHNDGNRLNNAVTNLRWDSPRSNALDMLEHGTHPQANATHCRNGHEFTPANTINQVRKETGRLRRVCRTCSRARTDRWYAENRAAVRARRNEAARSAA